MITLVLGDPGRLRTDLEWLSLNGPFDAKHMTILIDFIKNPAARRITSLSINEKRAPENSAAYFSPWYQLTWKDRAAIASAIEHHNTSLCQLEIQGPNEDDPRCDQYSLSLWSHGTRWLLYRNEELHDRVAGAVQRTLALARILFRGRAIGPLPPLPPEVLTMVVSFATQDTAALTSTQLAHLVSHASSSQGLMDMCRYTTEAEPTVFNTVMRDWALRVFSWIPPAPLSDETEDDEGTSDVEETSEDEDTDDDEGTNDAEDGSGDHGEYGGVHRPLRRDG